jgi:hypothetical protein
VPLPDVMSTCEHQSMLSAVEYEPIDEDYTVVLQVMKHVQHMNNDDQSIDT